MATVSHRPKWAGGNAPLSPGGRVCPRGGASRPAGPSLDPFLVQRRVPPGFRVHPRKSPRPAGARAGRVKSLPCEVPADGALRAAPRTSRAAMFAIQTESPASFPHVAARHAIQADRERPAHLAPGAMGTTAQRFPRLGRGRVDGGIAESKHVKAYFQFVSTMPPCKRRVPETKKSRHRCPFRARCAARRLPSRRMRRGWSQVDIGTRLPLSEECTRASASCQPPRERTDRVPAQCGPPWRVDASKRGAGPVSSVSFAGAGCHRE